MTRYHLDGIRPFTMIVRWKRVCVVYLPSLLQHPWEFSHTDWFLVIVDEISDHRNYIMRNATQEKYCCIWRNHCITFCLFNCCVLSSLAALKFSSFSMSEFDSFAGWYELGIIVSKRHWQFYLTFCWKLASYLLWQEDNIGGSKYISMQE